MGWSQPEDKPKEYDASLYKEERMWITAYPDSQERWAADFKPWYNLVGAYEVDDNNTLYRFRLDESRKAELSPYSPRFYNVLIPHKIEP